VPLPQSADLVRVTDDGRYLYAVATTAAPPAVYRIDRSSMTLDTTLVPLFSDSEPPEWQRISDFQPIPGQPHSFVASFASPGLFKGMAAFDDAVRRPRVPRTAAQGEYRKISVLVGTAAPT
jgi:hypothetical protein